MKLLQILFLMTGMMLLSPAFADDDGGEYEAAPVSYAVPEQEEEYDDGDYGAAPVAWDTMKPTKKPAATARQPKKKVVKKVSTNTKKARQQQWARLQAGQDAFE
jgi:hypothetical protein